ncbi:MAG: outer membrane beta-barrel protein, partial [Gemmatimonadaceae bacterium]
MAASTNQPLFSAAVVIRGGASVADTSRAGSTSVRADGTFHLSGLRPGYYTVYVRAIGYVPVTRTGVIIRSSGDTIDVGQISLVGVAIQLGSVRVAEDRDATALAPDRNTYATKDLPAAAGGTAIDLLRNVPQVEVDADNNVALRGNQSVVVQINGRPSPLRGQQLGNYLAQLPAGMVARVEVITNPSARNDPDGAAGIVNLVLSQRADLGTSGGVTAATSTTGLANITGNLGRQEGPWTGFASYGFYRDGRSLSGGMHRYDLGDPTPAGLFSRLSGRTRAHYHDVTLRGAYKFTTVDVLEADVVLSTGVFTRSYDAQYTAIGSGGDATGRFAQLTDARLPSTTGDYVIAWRHTVDALKNAFSVELRLTQADNNYLNSITGTSDTTTVTRATRELIEGHAPTYRLQADWTRALGAAKLEAGVLGIRRRATSDVESATLAANGDVDDPSRGNAYAYHENVASVYGVLSARAGTFDLQGGLRL